MYNQYDKYKNVSFIKTNMYLSLVCIACIFLLKVVENYNSYMDINGFDNLTILLSIVNFIVSLIFNGCDKDLKKQTISISLTCLSLFFLGFSLFAHNNLMYIHKLLFYIPSICLFVIVLILFLTNDIGLDVNKNEQPNVMWNLVASIVGAVITISLIVITKSVSGRYYDGSLTLFIGSIIEILASVYAMVVGINLKKIRKGVV